MRIHRLILQLLVLNIVFSNLAWAVDECTFLLEEPFQYTSISIDTVVIANHLLSEDDSDKIAKTCNFHCFTHTHTLFNNNNLFDVLFLVSASDVILFQSSYRSIQGQPPTQPPKA